MGCIRSWKEEMVKSINMAAMAKVNVLYIDSYDQNLLAFYAYFRAFKEFEIHLCSTTREALQILMDFPIDIIIIDQPLPTQVGIEFLEDLPTSINKPLKIVVTSHRDISLIEKVVENELIFNYFNKPYELNKINKAIEAVYAKIQKKGIC